MDSEPAIATSQRRRISWFTASAGASLALLVLIPFVASKLDSRKHYLSLSEDFHVSLDYAGLHFYSEGKYGPYRGSVIGFSEDPNRPKVAAFNFPCYYRDFQWPNGDRMWTLTIFLPLVLLPFCVLPGIWLVRVVRRGLAAKNPPSEYSPDR